MKRKLQLTLSTFALIVATGAFLHFGRSVAVADSRDRDSAAEVFTVDVAVDHETFAVIPSAGLVLHPVPVGPNRGSTFLVDGKIFSGGTLQKGIGVGDPNMAGSIGNFLCRGTFTSALGTEDIGFNTTQEFEFNGDADAIWTEGLEGGLGKQGVVTHRAILGGTGRFHGAQGEVLQEALGTNQSGTPNIRLTFHIQRDR
jgi:hypothetical protein